jgi:glycosyltransferase involved in cell wall biosynthesis
MTIEHALPAEQAADLVRQLYRAFLEREPGENELAAHGERMQLAGMTIAVSGIVYSEEALAIRARKDRSPRPDPPEGVLAIDRADVAEVVARVLAVARPDAPSAYEIGLRVDDFEHGTALATVLQDAFQVCPLPQEPAENGASIDQTIAILYRLALGRVPGPDDLKTWREAFHEGGRLSNVVFGIGESAEAKQLRGALDVVPGLKVQLAFEIVLGRGAAAAEVEHFRAMVDRQGLDISPLVWQLFVDEAKKRLLPAPLANDPHQAYIFGSRGVVNIDDWGRSTQAVAKTTLRHNVLGLESIVRLRPAEECVVSIITSLYCGGAFIRSFLENMTSQTIFKTHCELIIIDANSPDDERAVIEEFCRDFPNILYKRMDARIGIYEAWNIAAEMASGRYLTNANIDDIRRNDSFEIQAALLDTLDFVDVTYQDVFYSFEPRLPFDTIAKRDFRSNLPVISRYNLMEFNSPHNAPMWRAALHRDIGQFNQTLQSASDFEFWLRCRAAGKIFYKVNEAHVAYFVNPEGMSTRPDTRGAIEAHAVSRDLYRKIVSPMLVISDDEFVARVEDIAEVPLRTGRRYDIVQSALIALGAQRKGLAA